MRYPKCHLILLLISLLAVLRLHVWKGGAEGAEVTKIKHRGAVNIPAEFRGHFFAVDCGGWAVAVYDL